MITSFALLYINPYPCNLYIVNTEPLVAPVLLGYGLVSAFKLIKQVFTYQLTLHEVRLKKDGMHIEIGTLSYLGRELEKGKFTVNIQELKPPPIYSDSAPMTGDLFPTHPEEFKIANYVKNPWVKYYSEVRAKYYIPKDYDYMDTDLMIAIMDGKFINTYDY